MTANENASEEKVTAAKAPAKTTEAAKPAAAKAPAVKPVAPKTVTAKAAEAPAKAPAEKEDEKSGNEKADKFLKFLAENKINVFSSESLSDELKTVVFRSRIETNGQILPMAVIIDNSVFTIIRTQVASGLSIEKQDKVIVYLNALNEKYKIFKYYLRPDGIIFVDVCIPFVNETFDSNMIQLMLSVLVQNLEETFTELMSLIWGKEIA